MRLWGGETRGASRGRHCSAVVFCDVVVARSCAKCDAGRYDDPATLQLSPGSAPAAHRRPRPAIPSQQSSPRRQRSLQSRSCARQRECSVDHGRADAMCQCDRHDDIAAAGTGEWLDRRSDSAACAHDDCEPARRRGRIPAHRRCGSESRCERNRHGGSATDDTGRRCRDRAARGDGRRHRRVRRLHPDARRHQRCRQLRARGRARQPDQLGLRRSGRRRRFEQCERAGRSVRARVRFTHRRADQWRTRAAHRCRQRCCRQRHRRRWRQQLSIRNDHGRTGHRCRRHGVLAAAGRVSFSARGSRQLPARSQPAGRTCIPVRSEHRRPGADTRWSVSPERWFLRGAIRSGHAARCCRRHSG